MEGLVAGRHVLIAVDAFIGAVALVNALKSLVVRGRAGQVPSYARHRAVWMGAQGRACGPLLAVTSDVGFLGHVQGAPDTDPEPMT